MGDTSFQNTNVDLDGLLEVLGKSLYSTPSVALRELIQNASDACERHKIEAEERDDYQINIRCDPDGHKLIISDNGSGLTREEIQSFLATIGSGYSRLLRNQTQSEDIIGYFGLGFLTAYVVSSKVEVVSTSYKNPNETWRFVSAKGKTYTLSEAEPHPVGTTVYLTLDTEFYSLSDQRVVISLIRRYCCMLPVPIKVDGDQVPVNDLEIPWELPADVPVIRRRRSLMALASVFESAFEPLVCIEIPNDNDLNLKGLLWIQDGGTYASSDNRNVSIFIRNMFITNEDKNLLPRWAGFCGAVLESTQFKPTASRESMQRDDYYVAVQDYVRELLATNLRRIVMEEPEAWRRILARHNEALLGAAVADDRLFETMCRSLKVATTEGDLTIPQILSRGDGKIYVKPGARSGHEEILFRVRGNPLVKGYLFGTRAFCQKYHEVHQAELHEFGVSGSNVAFLTMAVDLAPETKSLCEDLFASSNHEIAFTRFDPDHIPILIIEDHDTVVKNRIEDDESDKRISAGILGLARMQTGMQDRTKERTVYINLANPIIEQLASMDPEKQRMLGDLLLSLMEFLCLDVSQNEEGLEKVFSRFSSSILGLIA